MVSRRTTLNPLLRLLAAGTLLCWLGALGLCSADCFEGDSDHQAGHGEIAASPADKDAQPESKNHSHHDDSACAALKTLGLTTHHDVLPKPDFGFHLLSFVLPPQALVAAECETPITCQPPDREWLFTPAVCLGPAFRSLAPPVLL